MLCEKCNHKKVQVINYGSAKAARAMCGYFGTELAFDKDAQSDAIYRMRYKAPLESCEAFEEKKTPPKIVKEAEKKIFVRDEHPMGDSR